MRVLLYAVTLVFIGAAHFAAVPTAAGQTKLADETAIRKIVGDITAAYNRHDAKAYAAYFGQAGELITVRGEKLSGSAAVEGGMAKEFRGTAKRASLRNSSIQITFVADDVAIVNSTTTITGEVNAGGRRLADREALTLYVFQRVGADAWRPVHVGLRPRFGC